MRFVVDLDGERAGDDGVESLGEGIKLLVRSAKHLVFEQEPRPAVELEQSHVQLHGEICTHHTHDSHSQTHLKAQRKNVYTKIFNSVCVSSSHP